MLFADNADTTTTEIGIAEDHSGDHYSKGSILQDTALWVLIPFLIVIGIFWRVGVHKKVGAQLDTKIQSIADELDEARTLREEAQELLAKYQRRQREAEEEAEDIIAQAKTDAKRLGEEMRNKLEEQLERRSKAAEEKITRAEEQAIAELRNNTADLSIAAATRIIQANMGDSAQKGLIDSAISDVKNRLN